MKIIEARPTRLKGSARASADAVPEAGALRPLDRGFTMLEVLLSLALVALLLVGLNTFMFSMAELWGKGADARLFDQHVLAVTRYLDHELHVAVLPPAARTGDTPIAGQEIHPQNGPFDTLLTFELPEGTHLLAWPERPLPEVVCSLQVRDGEGLLLLWHSKLETKFSDESPRENVISPFVTALTYDYYDSDFKRWTTETILKKDATGAVQVPQRIRLKFTYRKFSKETAVALPVAMEGLPAF